ncbi:NAD-dependent epimerase/dehydratase family protein [Paenibacillus sp. 7541]|uniref:NAD-dependent epimerase/dehydratase family protein n=1 Tax=Paenibacillus sp. 7541 TaxID=2026236 RepID=UPI000BA5F7B3|nr:NAD-dependent epimerase/dehydratase family protein [Paenibacillus sp. 7541]PAK52019.1 hypothetical protein CHH75_13390 [Paenibacillus sp. 7541]
MKALVTGGAGFIGSHLVDLLINEGHEVTVIDNLITGNKENINSNARFIFMDVCSPDLETVFTEHGPDCVFHLAAQASVGESIKDPIKDSEINIKGLINVLENCKKNNVKKIIFSSTAAVYGTPMSLPITEEHITDPISFYGVSKLAAEMYIKTYNILYGIDYTILRYANVYGPRQNYNGEGGVISIFINRILNHEPPIILGTGEQTRDFIYVSDVARANLKASISEDVGTFNISSGTAISLTQLLDSLSYIRSVKISPLYQNHRIGDIAHSCLENRMAELKLNWKPIYKLEDGLKITLDYYTEHQSNLVKGAIHK